MAQPKKAPSARTRKRAAASAAPKDVEGTEHFHKDPDGTIRWRMPENEEGRWYHLRPLTAGDYSELDFRHRLGLTEVVSRLTEAATRSPLTPEEQAEQLEALKAANRAQVTWIYQWYEALFEACEADNRPFPVEWPPDDAPEAMPKSEAPAWVFRTEFMGAILGQLAGPLPPGVL